MSSTRRINASRANGARSHGPVTESGKQISSQNACRHALLARCVVVEGESNEGFEETLNEHLDRFQPADGVEFGIVEEMVAAWWRMRRSWAIETRLLSDSVDAQNPSDGNTDRLTAAFSSLAESHTLALLHRYETRLHRMYQRGIRTLQLLRSEKAPNEPSPISEHRPAAGLADGDLPPDPPHNAPQPADSSTPSQSGDFPEAASSPLDGLPALRTAPAHERRTRGPHHRQRHGSHDRPALNVHRGVGGSVQLGHRSA